MPSYCIIFYQLFQKLEELGWMRRDQIILSNIFMAWHLLEFYFRSQVVEPLNNFLYYTIYFRALKTILSKSKGRHFVELSSLNLHKKEPTQLYQYSSWKWLFLLYWIFLWTWWTWFKPHVYGFSHMSQTQLEISEYFLKVNSTCHHTKDRFEIYIPT